MGAGPSIFFPLTAIQTVPFLIIAICLAIRGLMIAPEKQSLFKGLLVFYGIFVVTFFWAVISYTWMYSRTPYDALYHSLGFVGSIIILIVAQVVASRTSTKWRGLALRVYFGCWAFQLLMIAVPTGASTGFLGTESTGLSCAFYGVYAVAQIIAPMLAFEYTSRNKGRLIAERNTLISGSFEPVRSASQSSPYYSDNKPTEPTQSSPYRSDEMI